MDTSDTSYDNRNDGIRGTGRGRHAVRNARTEHDMETAGGTTRSVRARRARHKAVGASVRPRRPRANADGTARHAKRTHARMPSMDAVKILSVTTAAVVALSAGALSSTSMASPVGGADRSSPAPVPTGASAASRSDAREPIGSDVEGSSPSAPSKGGAASIAPSVSTNLDAGSWSLGEDLHIPYSKSPEEKAADLMAEQTRKDIERLRSEGVGKFTNDTELTLTADTMKQLNKVYSKQQPSGFDASHGTGDSGNAYPFSECTWWAYIRRHQLGLPAGSHLGNGNMWADSASSLGYWVDSTPHIGDAVSFRSGQDGADGYYGHVAVVENVFQYEGKTYIVTSESGHSFQGKHFSRILEDHGQYRYVHY